MYITYFLQKKHVYNIFAKSHFDNNLYCRYAQDMPFRGPGAFTDVPEWSPDLRQKIFVEVSLTSFWLLGEPQGGVLTLLRAL